ncbi:MAG: multicopper oxidase domain-containing protein, partial [Candidatus Acidiferrales bacterium]
MDRRTFIRAAFANLGALALDVRTSSAGAGILRSPGQVPSSAGPQILPPGNGTTREINLTPAPAQFELPTYGVFNKWLFNGQFPGPEIRAREGERLRITV